MVKPAAVRNRASAGRTGPVVSKAEVSIQWLGRTERWGRHHQVKTAESTEQATRVIRRHQPSFATSQRRRVTDWVVTSCAVPCSWSAAISGAPRKTARMPGSRPSREVSLL